MYVNSDPIIAAGIKQITGVEESPVLVSRLSNEVISGFKEPDYERVTKLFYSVAGASAPSIFAGEQQPVPQAPVENRAETKTAVTS